MTGTAIVVGADSLPGRRVSKHQREAGFDVSTCGQPPYSDIVPDLDNFEDVGCPRPIDADVLMRCATIFAADDVAGTVDNERANGPGCLALAQFGNDDGDCFDRHSIDLYEALGTSPRVSIGDSVGRLSREGGPDQSGDLDVA